MPRHVELILSYLAPVTFVPAGGRKERSVWTPGVATVAIPSLEEHEAPVVLSAHGHEGLLQVRRAYEGDLYGPIDDVDRHGRGWSDEAKLRDRAASFGPCGHMLFARSPWKEARTNSPVPRDARILSDGRPAMAERVSGRGSDLALIGGRAFVRSGPPVLCVIDWGMSGARIVLRDWPGCNYSFDLSRLEVAKDFVARNVGPGGYGELAGELPVIEVLDPGVARMDETVPNSSKAIANAMHAVKDRLPHLSREVLIQLSELARVRDGLRDGSCGPMDADAVLAALDALRPGMGRATQLLHAIRIGRDAIASSMSGNGAVARFAPEDEEALSGLAA